MINHFRKTKTYVTISRRTHYTLRYFYGSQIFLWVCMTCFLRKIHEESVRLKCDSVNANFLDFVMFASLTPQIDI